MFPEQCLWGRIGHALLEGVRKERWKGAKDLDFSPGLWLEWLLDVVQILYLFRASFVLSAEGECWIGSSPMLFLENCSRRHIKFTILAIFKCTVQ